ALKRHDIGYHSNWHSVHPVGAEYLEPLGYLEGADEFQRREEPGIRDIQRIFGVTPSCYGQPGFAWAPQPNLALRRLGIPVYLDHDSQVGIDHQPFYLSNLFYVLDMGSNFIRPDFNEDNKNPTNIELVRAAVSRLAQNGGGTITTWLHPNECVETEWWDAINFDHGAQPSKRDWKTPKMRTQEDSERCYSILHEYVQQVSRIPGVRWLNASEVFTAYDGPTPPVISPLTAARSLQSGITFLETPAGNLSASEALLQMLGLGAGYVDGPTSRGITTFSEGAIPAELFAAARDDFANSVQTTHRLPAQVYLGAQSLSLADFAATAAAVTANPDAPVTLHRGNLLFENYVSRDPAGPFHWGILPVGFSAPHLLELTRLQAWTLKPARLRQ
ncbi:MAG TPA: hypothetical protein VGL82_16865, partial [Bryobacteraceae bacterium]